MDPYAKVVGRPLQWHESLFGFRSGEDDTTFDDARQRRACARSPPSSIRPSRGATIDRCGRRGTKQSSTSCTSGDSRRGIPTFPNRCGAPISGLATEPAIRHLTSLGVTAVELMPVHHHLDEWHLVKRGLTNYWGYNTLAFFAPDVRYAVVVVAARDACASSRRWSARCMPPASKSFSTSSTTTRPKATTRDRRCRCAASTTRRTTASQPHAPRYYEDFTGCGNTLNMRSPRVLQLIMDSLRYWVHGDARGRVPLRSRERAGS